MPAGLTIFNNGGTVQIDENWKNYGYRYKFSATFSVYDTSPPNPPGYNGATYQVALGGSPQMLVACKAATLLPVKQHSYYSGGTWYLNWLFMKQLGMLGVTVSETVEFYVFDAMDGSYSNVGMEVFNASGERVFHSDAPIMRLGGANVGIQPCNTPFYGDSGRTYVPLILTPPFVAASVGFGTRHFSYGNRSLGSYIHAEGTPQLGSLASLTTADLPGLYAAIDVTGL